MFVCFTGRVENKRVGGGHRQRNRIIDFTKDNNKDGKPVEERVLRTLYDTNRSGYITIAATGNKKDCVPHRPG